LLINVVGVQTPPVPFKKKVQNKVEEPTGVQENKKETKKMRLIQTLRLERNSIDQRLVLFLLFTLLERSLISLRKVPLQT